MTAKGTRVGQEIQSEITTRRYIETLKHTAQNSFTTEKARSKLIKRDDYYIGTGLPANQVLKGKQYSKNMTSLWVLALSAYDQRYNVIMRIMRLLLGLWEACQGYLIGMLELFGLLCYTCQGYQGSQIHLFRVSFVLLGSKPPDTYSTNQMAPLTLLPQYSKTHSSSITNLPLS